MDISSLLSAPANWAKWNQLRVVSELDSKQIPNPSGNETTFTLTMMNPALFTLKQQKGNDSVVQVISLQSLKRGDNTQVIWVAEKNGFQWLKEKLTGYNEIPTSLDNLKKFAESTSDLYGFPIRLTKVVDPFICTKRIAFPQGNSEAHVQELLTKVKQFIKDDHMTATKDYYYVSSYPLVDGRSELTVGIPVKYSFIPKNGVELLALPADGNILVGSYKGLSSGVQSIYNAMDKYVTDKHLGKVAHSMEQYPDSATTTTAGGVKNIQLIYPVY